MQPWILTCEHAGYAIPDWAQKDLNIPLDVLTSHRGWDPGAWPVACKMAEKLNAPLYGYPYTRLFIEANRSLNHPQIFSEWAMKLEPSLRARAINYLYLPFRQQVQQAVASEIKKSGAVHLSIHSFTPVLNGQVRQADIGILYDPRREGERRLATILQIALQAQDLRVRLNYPYLGRSDGHVTSLRKAFSQGYIGLEIEVNQALVATVSDQRRVAQALLKALTSRQVGLIL